MKSIILFLALISSNISFAQSGWVPTNPQPTGNILTDGVMVNPNTIYAVGKHGGPFVKTTNGGVSWTAKDILPIKDSTRYNAISLCASDENNICILYSYEFIFVENIRYFVMRSTNAGQTWDSVFIAERPREDLGRMRFVNQTTGYCFSYEYHGYGVFKTTNGGANWQEYKVNSTNDTLQSLFFVNANTGWMGGYGNNNYYRTTNGGTSWATYITSNFDFFYKPFFINENTGWYCGGSYLAKTTNGGINFLNTGTIPGVVDDFGFADENTGWCISSSNIYSTSNSGVSWQMSYSRDSTNSNISSIRFLNSTTGVAAGWFGGIFKTTNKGLNWSELSRTQNKHAYISDVQFINQLTGWAAMYPDLMKTTDGGNNWNKIYTDSIYRLKFYNENIGMAMGVNSFSSTTNGGQSWAITNYEGYFFTSAFLYSPNTWYVIGVNAGDYRGVIVKTTNAGVTWNTLAQPPGNTFLVSAFFVTENTGYFSTGSSIFKTTNGGTNWFATGDGNTQSIYFYNETTGWAMDREDIYKTTNSGLTFQRQFTKGFYSYYSMKFVNAQTGWCVGFGLNSGVILKTTNGGTNWSDNLSFYTGPLYAISFINDNTGWIVGSGETIIKTTTGGTIGVQQISTTVPDKFYLEQNYPNPFNPNTVISFQLSVAGFVKLKVFDLLGREVGNLLNENLSSGKYKYDFNATLLPSGIYFYKLETENFSETRKMVLVK